MLRVHALGFPPAVAITPARNSFLFADHESGRVDEEKTPLRSTASVQSASRAGNGKKMTVQDWLKNRRFYEVQSPEYSVQLLDPILVIDRVL